MALTYIVGETVLGMCNEIERNTVNKNRRIARDDRGPLNAVRRTPERVVLVAAGLYNVLMASLTIFVYANWLRTRSYEILQSHGLLASGLMNADALVYVSQIYGLLLAALGICSLVVASRRMKEATISRGVMIYIGVCLVFSLITADWLGLVAYGVCLTLYCARNKAIRRARQNIPLQQTVG